MYLVNCYETLRFSLHIILPQLLVSFTFSSLKKGERYWSFCTKSYSDKKTGGYYLFKALFSLKLKTTPYLYLLLSPYSSLTSSIFPTREPGGIVMLKGVVSAGTRGINIRIDEGNSSCLFLCVSRDYTRPPPPLMATLQFFLFLMVGFRTDCCELLCSLYILE